MTNEDRRAALLAQLAELPSDDEPASDEEDLESVEPDNPVAGYVPAPPPERPTDTFVVHYAGENWDRSYCSRHGCFFNWTKFHSLPVGWLEGKTCTEGIFIHDGGKHLESVVCSPSNGIWTGGPWEGMTTWEVLCFFWDGLGIARPDLKELRRIAKADGQYVRPDLLETE